MANNSWSRFVISGHIGYCSYCSTEIIQGKWISYCVQHTNSSLCE